MHQEALTEHSQKLFPKLAHFSNFYLAGGTALALQVGHRRSIDFDLFTAQELPDRLLPTVKSIFSGSNIAVTYSAPEQLNVLVDEIRVTLLYYEYPLIEPLINIHGVPVANVREIAAMKAFSIGRRISYKDYVDWYFMLSEKHVDLPDIVKLAGQKYDNDFNDRLFLGQLASVGEVEEVPIEYLRGAVDHHTIRNYLEKEVSDYKI
ncbi:MAG: nucleotidyl transferase AbiEii/AbiGii toxin family protein [bacterium]